MPEPVENFLQVLRDQEHSRQARIAEALAAKRQQAEEDQHQAQLDELKRFHDQEAKHQETVAKATAANLRLKQMLDFQEIGQKRQEKGAPVPTGLDVVPNDQGGETILDPSQQQPQQIPGVIGQVPLPARMEIRQPDVYAREQAHRNDLLIEPQIRKAQEIADNQAANVEAQRKRDAIAAEARDHARAIDLQTRQAEHDRVLENIAAGHDRARVQPTGIVSNLPGGVLAEYLRQAREGDKSLEDFKKIVPAKEQGAFFNAATAAGVGFLNNKQKELLGIFQPAFDALRKTEELNSLWATDKLLGLKTNDNAKRARTLKKEVNESLISAATALGQNRLSDPRVKAMTDAYEQSLNPITGSVENNRKTAQDFHDYLLNTLNSKLLGIPDDQKQIYIDKLELGRGGAVTGGRQKLEDILFGGKK